MNTVFLGASSVTVRRPESSRRSTFGNETPRRLPSGLQSPRFGPEKKEGTPIDDLRRKLVAMDSSNVSLQTGVSTPLRERRESVNSVASSAQTAGLHVTPMLEKSPPESVVSGVEPVSGISARRRQRIQLSSDGKAPALVGSVRTNALGVLEAPSTLRPVHEDTSLSERSSPASQAGAIKRDKVSVQSNTAVPSIAVPTSGALIYLALRSF